MTVTDIVDGITYAGGPITASTRNTILNHAEQTLGDNLLLDRQDKKRERETKSSGSKSKRISGSNKKVNAILVRIILYPLLYLCS